MSPTKPFVEVTGPEKVVEAIISTFLHKDSLRSLCNVRRAEPVYKANMLTLKEVYSRFGKKERGLERGPSLQYRMRFCSYAAPGVPYTLRQSDTPKE